VASEIYFAGIPRTAQWRRDNGSTILYANLGKEQRTLQEARGGTDSTEGEMAEIGVVEAKGAKKRPS